MWTVGFCLLGTSYRTGVKYDAILITRLARALRRIYKTASHLFHEEGLRVYRSDRAIPHYGIDAEHRYAQCFRRQTRNKPFIRLQSHRGNQIVRNRNRVFPDKADIQVQISGKGGDNHIHRTKRQIESRFLFPSKFFGRGIGYFVNDWSLM